MMKKNTTTRTLLVKKSAAPSPAAKAEYVDTTAAARKSAAASVEFPTSPEALFGEEIVNFSHPQHPLIRLDLPDLFTCSGCKDYGSGKRFLCRHCDFQIHDFCALAPAALKAHPLHSQHLLMFNSKPKPKKCDVCGKHCKGFAFICGACGFQMHPCCAMLSNEIEFSGHPHTLKLLPSSTNSSTNDSAGFVVCGECKKRRSGRVYQCTVCDYYVHAFCAKNMVNGLRANGIKGPEKPSMLGTAARLASQVVVDFLGGLIEGLGEGMGEVLVQNIARGSAHDKNNTNSVHTTTNSPPSKF